MSPRRGGSNTRFPGRGGGIAPPAAAARFWAGGVYPPAAAAGSQVESAETWLKWVAMAPFGLALSRRGSPTEEAV